MKGSRSPSAAPDHRRPSSRACPPIMRELFFPSSTTAQPTTGLRFMGFFVQDPTVAGRSSGNSRTFPASIAIGYGINGLTGARQASRSGRSWGCSPSTSPGRRLFGRTVAAAVAPRCSRSTSSRSGSPAIPTPKWSCRRCCSRRSSPFARAPMDDYRFFGPVAGAAGRTADVPAYDAVLASWPASPAATLADGSPANGLAGVVCNAGRVGRRSGGST